jgi:hypothetical protein
MGNMLDLKKNPPPLKVHTVSNFPIPVSSQGAVLL